MSGSAADVQAVTDGRAAASSGVAHAETLVAFTEALVADDEEALVRTRAAIREKLGPAQLVDAAAVASNFERMVRIADSTGIPLDGPLDLMSADLREELDLARFGSAANTPEAGMGKRILGSAVRPVAHGALRILGTMRRPRRTD